MNKPSPSREARKFEQYYETWRATHGQEAAALWLAATAGSLSARMGLLEKQLKHIQKIVKQNAQLSRRHSTEMLRRCGFNVTCANWDAPAEASENKSK